MICIFAIMPSQPKAASYSFKFEPPYYQSMKYTGYVKVTKAKSAYVTPGHSTTPTTYYLRTSTGALPEATNYHTHISTAGKRSFTYKSGYGGVGNSYSLAGYPSNTDFVRYNISGTWSP